MPLEERSSILPGARLRPLAAGMATVLSGKRYSATACFGRVLDGDGKRSTDCLRRIRWKPARNHAAV